MSGKIYIIRNKHDENLIYIGSTFADLNYRFNRHKFQTTTRLHRYITENNDDWDNWDIELYEEIEECNSKEQLLKREGEVIRLFLNENPLGTLNKGIAGRTKKEYIQDNKDKIKDIRKRYYHKNIDKFKKIITCECGRNFRKDNIYRHLKSKVHQSCSPCPPITSTTIISGCDDIAGLPLNPEPDLL